jgi:hypothetical protein
MTVAVEPFFTVKVERAATRGLGLHQANAAASEYYYPDHLFEIVRVNLFQDHRYGSPRPYWVGSVTFRALQYETHQLPSYA